MKNNIIKIEQTLHGYSLGHHLLGASVNLSNNSLKIMSILSDLSGPEVYNGFTEYVTGYPLLEDGYYALAKTWYAPEMERPGCAWTHTFLIGIGDLSKIIDSLLLINFFKRPGKNFIKDDYCTPIEIRFNINNKNNFLNPNNIFLHKYKLLTWSLYNDDRPIIVPSDSNDGYEDLILLIWQNQWEKLRSNFTFCTGSFTNRKFGGKTFDIQITHIALSKNISRSDPTSFIVDYSQNINNQFEYPEWLNYLITETAVFHDFLCDFGDVFAERKYFKKLAQLFLSTENINNKSIGIYFDAAQAIFSPSDYFLIMENFLNKLYKSMPNRWVAYNDIISLFQDLSTITLKVSIPYNKQPISSQLKLLWRNDKKSVKNLLKWLISSDLNQFGEELLEEHSELIKPDELGDLTDMDLGACSVLVSLNTKLAVSRDIWHKSKDFQCEIIDCIGKSNLNLNAVQDIIETILDNSAENVIGQMFKVFGETLISVFLAWGQKRNDIHDSRLHSWIEICKYSPAETIRWVSSCTKINIEYLALILSVLDPYSPSLIQFGLKPWSGIFEQISNKNYDSQLQLKLAQFFLPISLKSDESIARDFAIFSYYPVHNALANDQFSYEQWKKLEPLLPELPWYKTWDKCKRLKMAMEKKGYI